MKRQLLLSLLLLIVSFTISCEEELNTDDMEENTQSEEEMVNEALNFVDGSSRNNDDSSDDTDDDGSDDNSDDSSDDTDDDGSDDNSDDSSDDTDDGSDDNSSEEENGSDDDDDANSDEEEQSSGDTTDITFVSADDLSVVEGIWRVDGLRESGPDFSTEDTLDSNRLFWPITGTSLEDVQYVQISGSKLNLLGDADGTTVLHSFDLSQFRAKGLFNANLSGSVSKISIVLSEGNLFLGQPFNRRDRHEYRLKK